MQTRTHLPGYPPSPADRNHAAEATLRIDGLVARPLELRPADLSQLPRTSLEEAFVCEEGWSVPGLRWGGFQLSQVLALAQPLAEACYVRAASGAWVVPLALSDAARGWCATS